MRRPLVANELSFVAGPDRRVAVSRLTGFVRTLQHAVSLGAERGLRSTVPLGALPLAPNYVFAQWRNDPDVDLEARRWVRSMQINCPAISATDDEALRERELTSEFRCAGTEARGLGAAWLLDGLGVSLTSDPRWDAAEVQVDADHLDQNCTLSSDVLSIRHRPLR